MEILEEKYNQENNVEKVTIYYIKGAKPNSNYPNTDQFEGIASFQMLSHPPYDREITFMYISKSTGKKSRATFNLNSIAGYALTYKNKEEQ